MNGPQEQFEREEEALCNDFNAGLITRSEYDAGMRDLLDAYRGAMDEACWDAFDREREKW